MGNGKILDRSKCTSSSSFFFFFFSLLIKMSPAPPSAGGVPNPNAFGRPLGFLANAKKRKQSFIQFFAMTGILLLSFRSLGQKYRMYSLTEDAAALRDEQESLTSRMSRIKQCLLDEAAREPTGAFAARLRILFGDETN